MPIPLHVKAGVPSWIVNIALRQVESYRSAADLELAYGRVSTEGDRFEILGIGIAVAELFEKVS